MRSTAQSPFGGGSCWTFHKTTEAQSVHKSQLCWKCKSQKWHIPSRWPQTSWERTEKSILLSPKGKKVSNYTFLNLLPPPQRKSTRLGIEKPKFSPWLCSCLYDFNHQPSSWLSISSPVCNGVSRLRWDFKVCEILCVFLVSTSKCLFLLFLFISHI